MVLYKDSWIIAPLTTVVVVLVVVAKVNVTNAAATK